MNQPLASSISARLGNLAKERGEDFQQVLTRYGLERFLYRLMQPRSRDSFCLKGALLFAIWFDAPHRPTRDADLLGTGPADAERLARTLEQACAITSEDGMFFDPATIRISEIRKDARYSGMRATLMGYLARSRCPVQIDVGFGDAITPAPEEAVYPTLLHDLPAPRLRIYPRATVMAEKLDAVVVLGMNNSRMKDYFDLLMLAREKQVSDELLVEALVATFRRRGTTMPAGTPTGLEREFAMSPARQSQWQAFLGKHRLSAPSLVDTVDELRASLSKPLTAAIEAVRATS